MLACFSIVTGTYILFYSAVWRSSPQSLLAYHFCGCSTLYIKFGMKLKIKFLLELMKDNKFICFITATVVLGNAQLMKDVHGIWPVLIINY